MRNLMITALVATLPLVATPAFAVDELNVSNGIAAPGAPLAVHGADPVALLNDGKVLDGSAEHGLAYEGAS